MIKYSIVLLLYNSDVKKTIMTLNSVIEQNLNWDELEIVIADDGSEVLIYDELKEFLESRSFYQYKMTMPKKNVGTVKNILDGLALCTGKYIKLIGSGDLLFDKETLNHVYNHMEQKQCVMCFGLMRGYYYDGNGGLKQEPFRAPKDIAVYKKVNYDWKRLKKNIIVFGDWISGASMFFERTVLKNYLQKMEDIVIYCEDLITANLVLDKRNVSFLDETLIWYEIGMGITTLHKEENPFLKKIYKDHEQYYNSLLAEYPKEKSLYKGIRMMNYNRGGVFSRKILRNVTEPSRIVFAIRINIQKIQKRHWGNDVGFLNCNIEVKE